MAEPVPEPEVEEIAVAEILEPESLDDGVVDPNDTYREGPVHATTAPGDEPCGLPEGWEAGA